MVSTDPAYPPQSGRSTRRPGSTRASTSTSRTTSPSASAWRRPPGRHPIGRSSRRGAGTIAGTPSVGSMTPINERTTQGPQLHRAVLLRAGSRRGRPRGLPDRLTRRGDRPGRQEDRRLLRPAPTTSSSRSRSRSRRTSQGLPGEDRLREVRRSDDRHELRHRHDRAATTLALGDGTTARRGDHVARRRSQGCDRRRQAAEDRRRARCSTSRSRSRSTRARTLDPDELRGQRSTRSSTRCTTTGRSTKLSKKWYGADLTVKSSQ